MILPLVALGLAAAGCSDRLAQRDGEGELRWGERIHAQLGCPACHSPSGARLQGPPLGQEWGAQVRLRSGEVVTRDEAYVRQSIVDPSSQVLEDYFPVMVPYLDLTEGQLDALVAYYRSTCVEPAPDPVAEPVGAESEESENGEAVSAGEDGPAGDQDEPRA